MCTSYGVGNSMNICIPFLFFTFYPVSHPKLYPTRSNDRRIRRYHIRHNMITPYKLYFHGLLKFCWIDRYQVDCFNLVLSLRYRVPAAVLDVQIKNKTAFVQYQSPIYNLSLNLNVNASTIFKASLVPNYFEVQIPCLLVNILLFGFMS